MALAEDAASVLEEFVQNVANLPAEIAHLLEEIQAKDRIVQECRSQAASRDASIQKSVKLNGVSPVNPKEEQYTKTILSHYDKAHTFQEEKIGLADRAAILLDRQIKRLDLKIRDLQNEGSIAIDPQLPSLLNNNSTLNSRLPPLLTSTSGGASTALHPHSGNPAGPSTTIAHNPLSRLVQPTRQPSPLTTAAPITASSQTSRATIARSPSTDPSKRRRLNTHLSIPPTGSSLRQSSLGPNTPKNTTNPRSRGNSADPRSQSATASGTGTQKNNKPSQRPPHQRINHLNPAHSNNTKSSSGGGTSPLTATATTPGNASTTSHNTHNNTTTNKKTKHTRPTANKRNKDHHHNTNHHTTDTESILSELSNANNPSASASADAMDIDNLDGTLDDNGDDGEEEEGEGDDTRKYCTCQKVSYGDMVACDNDECPYEWFHWACVGVKEEPKGAWFCEECRGRGVGK